jgi:hypothetical protein
MKSNSHLGVAAALEMLALFALHRGEKGFPHRIVVTIPAPAHTARDAVARKH